MKMDETAKAGFHVFLTSSEYGEDEIVSRSDWLIPWIQYNVTYVEISTVLTQNAVRQFFVWSTHQGMKRM